MRYDDARRAPNIFPKANHFSSTPERHGSQCKRSIAMKRHATMPRDRRPFYSAARANDGG